jgi:hypothetical protein
MTLKKMKHQELMNTQFVKIDPSCQQSNNEWINLPRQTLEESIAKLSFYDDDKRNFIPKIVTPLTTNLSGMQNCVRTKRG